MFPGERKLILGRYAPHVTPRLGPACLGAEGRHALPLQRVSWPRGATRPAYPRASSSWLKWRHVPPSSPAPWPRGATRPAESLVWGLRFLGNPWPGSGARHLRLSVSRHPPLAPFAQSPARSSSEFLFRICRPCLPSDPLFRIAFMDFSSEISSTFSFQLSLPHFSLLNFFIWRLPGAPKWGSRTTFWPPPRPQRGPRRTISAPQDPKWRPQVPDGVPKSPKECSRGANGPLPNPFRIPISKLSLTRERRFQNSTEIKQKTEMRTQRCQEGVRMGFQHPAERLEDLHFDALVEARTSIPKNTLFKPQKKNTTGGCQTNQKGAPRGASPRSILKLSLWRE